MSTNPFAPATKAASYLRMAISGPSGSGKTYTALQIATSLGGPVALVDTEHGSASKYADLFTFDVVNLGAPYHPDRFGQMIDAAVAAGYKVVIIDSATHEWTGSGGMLEIVDGLTRKYKGDSRRAWQDATPMHNAFTEKIISSPIHIILTMRSKTDYVTERDDRTGKNVMRKVGMAPVQRDGIEYEFDVWMEMDADNTGLVQKSRCPGLHNAVIPKPGQVLADTLAAWLAIKELPASPPPPPVVSSGDGAPGRPPETWAQKIEAAKDYLNRASTASEDVWQKEASRITDKVAEWPAPHAKEVREHIGKLRRERGEDVPQHEPAGPDVGDGDNGPWN